MEKIENLLKCIRIMSFACSNKLLVILWEGNCVLTALELPLSSSEWSDLFILGAWCLVLGAVILFY